jgi:signal transduction histidine kinase
VFNRVASINDRLNHVLRGEALSVIEALVDNAQRTGGAIAEYQGGSDLYRVTAKSLSSNSNVLVVFENITGIRHAGQALVDLVRYRSSFLEAVSQELRTPLTAVIGYAKLLAEPGEQLDDGSREAIARDMTDQAWDLAGMVEDLLTVARAELGDLRVARVPVNVAANVAQVLESMGERGKEIEVSGASSVTGVGDPARFRQVIRNLLSNSLAHGEPPVVIEVAEDADRAIARVIDEGPGLPDAIESIMFDEAVAGPGAGSPEQVGIGLWIARELANLMGGGFGYSREDGRTVFEVSIPILRPGPNQS